MSLKSKLFDSGTHQLGTSIGLLILRIGLGVMMIGAHGWQKVTNFSAMSEHFPDPLGLGSPTINLALAAFVEVVCSLALILGFLTRGVVIPLLATMLVAAFIVHSNDPWMNKEFALLYALPFLAFIFTGAGRFSVDAALHSK